jgi:hypothetical protein
VAKPSDYSEIIAIEIAARMVEDGQSLKRIAEDETMPSARTVLRWCRDHPEFDRLLSHARMAKADAYVEEAVPIADEPVTDMAQAARNRLRVQARLDAAAKLNPAKYSAKLAIGAAPDLPEFPLVGSAEPLSKNAIARRICFALAQGLKGVQDGKPPLHLVQTEAESFNDEKQA